MNCVKRIALMVIRNILLVPFMWCKLCYYAAHVDNQSAKVLHRLTQRFLFHAVAFPLLHTSAFGIPTHFARRTRRTQREKSVQDNLFLRVLCVLRGEN